MRRSFSDEVSSVRTPHAAASSQDMAGNRDAHSGTSRTTLEQAGTDKHAQVSKALTGEMQLVRSEHINDKGVHVLLPPTEQRGSGQRQAALDARKQCEREKMAMQTTMQASLHALTDKAKRELQAAALMQERSKQAQRGILESNQELRQKLQVHAEPKKVT